MAIFNSLTFDGQNSLDNGVYITAESSYDAPERDIEEIEIAGRNGAFLLDKGRWKNIEVTYKAGAFGSNQTEFASKIRDFRNLMASRIGYKRLTDTYNPNEFRLGTFKDAFEVKPESANRHGEFDLVFNCKPQRYLTSGETEITVSSGQTITNPTPYDASPLIMSQGSGYILLGDTRINLSNEAFGTIELIPYTPSPSGQMFYFKTDTFNDGDTIVYSAGQARWHLKPRPGFEIQSVSVSDSNAKFSTEVTYQHRSIVNFATHNNSLIFTAGQSQDAANTATATVTLKNTSTNATSTQTVTLNLDIQCGMYNDGNNINLDWTANAPSNYFYQNDILTAWACSRTTVDSTMLVLDGTTYIDCELGKVYAIRSGAVVPLNRYVELGNDLPVLPPGETVITHSNTVTSLKIIPRWWIL